MSEDKQQQNREKEHFWQNIEIVQLGEEFQLFDTTRKRTQIRYSDNGSFGGMKSSIRLETGLLDKLYISIAAAPYAKERYSVITPFDRHLGYPLDKDDLSLHSRVAKISRLKRDYAEVIQGLYLFVFVAYEDMVLNGILHALLQENAPLPGRDKASMLRHLFLTLKFPLGSSFTARALFNPRRRLLLFGSFFPSDTGPLPNVANAASSPSKTTGEHSAALNGKEKPGEVIPEGFDILLPFDQEKLQTIRARFLFLPDLD